MADARPDVSCVTCSFVGSDLISQLKYISTVPRPVTKRRRLHQTTPPENTLGTSKNLESDVGTTFKAFEKLKRPKEVFSGPVDQWTEEKKEALEKLLEQ